MMHRSTESFVLRCKACQEAGPRHNTIEPLQPHPIPGQPWSKLGSDNCYLIGEIYLTLIDYYSNFAIIRNMVTKSIKEVCVVLKFIFSENVIPKEFVTGQGLCYTATEFKVFCQSVFVKHTLCTAFHHSSNECTDRAIQEVKKILHKYKSEGCNSNLSLLQNRSTPYTARKKSPAELLG